MAPNKITPAQHIKLEALAEAMMDAVELMCNAGVVPANPAVAHCAEGHVAIMQLLYPEDRKPQ